MKKSLVALAVFGAFTGLAQADNSSVTVYGIVDAGVMTASKAPNPTAANPNNTGSVTAFQDAQMAPSIYGLKGTEDLGGGLKAGFQLEGGFSTANGTHNSPGVYQSQTFGREAKVTLGGDWWGTVAAGLQVDPALVAAISTEPRGMTDSLSSLEHWIVATIGSGTSFALQGGIFDANAVSYTYAGNGLFLGVLYGFGGVAGSSSANSQTSIGATYSNSGFTISGDWAQEKAPGQSPAYSGTGSEIYNVGLAYSFAPFAVRVQYGNYKSNYSNAGAADDVKNIGIGVDWKTGANTANLAWYQSKDDGANLGGKTTEIALMDSYSLSKRTSVYAQVASVKVDAYTATTGPGASAALGGIYTPVGLFAVAGSTTTFVGLGVQHVF